jgi:hypothetical protein
MLSSSEAPDPVQAHAGAALGVSRRTRAAEAFCQLGWSFSCTSNVAVMANRNKRSLINFRAVVVA